MVGIAWPLACTLCCAVMTYGLSLWVKLQREKDLSARALDAAMRAVHDVETLRKELAEVRETTRAVSSAIMEKRF